MKNKLNEEQQKRFNEKFRTGAENNLEMYDDSLGANCFSNAGIAPLARYLADEIARVKGEIINRLEYLIKCDKCDGIGAYSSPSDFGPCSDCEGTGVYIDGCFDDVLALLKREKENNEK